MNQFHPIDRLAHARFCPAQFATSSRAGTPKFRHFQVVQNKGIREAVAPKLLYLDNRIQHAGMVTGTRRLLGTAFHTYPRRTTANMNLAQALSHEPELASGGPREPAQFMRPSRPATSGTLRLGGRGACGGR